MPHEEEETKNAINFQNNKLARNENILRTFDDYIRN